MQNWLNRMKNKISDFSYFYFVSYGHFCDVITPIFDEFFTITRNIRIGEFFSFYSAHSASSMKTGSKLRGGGICISLVGTGPDIYASKDCKW